MTSSIPDSVPVNTHQNDLNLISTPERNRAGLSPLIVQSTNLQTGDHLVHRVKVPKFANIAPALISPSGISSVNLHPMSNGDSSHSFAMQANNMGMLNNNLTGLENTIEKSDNK